MNKFRITLLLFFVVLPLLNPLSSYFSQDDFFHLRIISDKNFSDIPSFFVTRLEGQTFYRPLSREVFNILMYKFFGFNPMPFHLVNLWLISLNIFLAYFLITNLTLDKRLSFVTAILYSLSTIHSVELYYLASVQTLFATSFILLSAISYIKFIRRGLSTYYLSSILFFLLGLLSHEMAVVTPAILFLIEVSLLKKSWKKIILRIVPIILFLFLYATTILFVNKLPNQSVYQPVFSIKSIINTLGWYMLWSFGLPEMLVDFVGPNLTFNLNFINWYREYFLIGSFSLVLMGLILIIIVFKFWNEIFKSKLLFLLISLFIVSLAPNLIFPQHKFVYYLSLPAIWFCAILALAISFAWSNKNFRILSIIFITVFAFLSYHTNQLNKITYWAAKRAQAAKYLLADIKKDYPIVEKGSTFYIKNDPNYPNISKEWGSSSKQAFFILSGADALQLLYKDPTITVYYEDVGGLPKNVTLYNILIAKFPY